MEHDKESPNFFGRIIWSAIVGGFAFAMLSFWNFWGLEGRAIVIVSASLGILFFYLGKNFGRWIENIFWWS